MSSLCSREIGQIEWKHRYLDQFGLLINSAKLELCPSHIFAMVTQAKLQRQSGEWISDGKVGSLPVANFHSSQPLRLVSFLGKHTNVLTLAISDHVGNGGR